MLEKFVNRSYTGENPSKIIMLTMVIMTLLLTAGQILTRDDRMMHQMYSHMVLLLFLCAMGLVTFLKLKERHVQRRYICSFIKRRQYLVMDKEKFIEETENRLEDILIPEDLYQRDTRVILKARHTVLAELFNMLLYVGGFLILYMITIFALKKKLKEWGALDGDFLYLVFNIMVRMAMLALVFYVFYEILMFLLGRFLAKPPVSTGPSSQSRFGSGSRPSSYSSSSSSSDSSSKPKEEKKSIWGFFGGKSKKDESSKKESSKSNPPGSTGFRFKEGSSSSSSSSSSSGYKSSYSRPSSSSSSSSSFRFKDSSDKDKEKSSDAKKEGGKKGFFSFGGSKDKESKKEEKKPAFRFIDASKEKPKPKTDDSWLDKGYGNYDDYDESKDPFSDMYDYDYDDDEKRMAMRPDDEYTWDGSEPYNWHLEHAKKMSWEERKRMDDEDRYGRSERHDDWDEDEQRRRRVEEEEERKRKKMLELEEEWRRKSRENAAKSSSSYGSSSSSSSYGSSGSSSYGRSSGSSSNYSSSYSSSGSSSSSSSSSSGGFRFKDSSSSSGSSSSSSSSSSGYKSSYSRPSSSSSRSYSSSYGRKDSGSSQSSQEKDSTFDDEDPGFIRWLLGVGPKKKKEKTKPIAKERLKEDKRRRTGATKWDGSSSGRRLPEGEEGSFLDFMGWLVRKIPTFVALLCQWTVWVMFLVMIPYILVVIYIYMYNFLIGINIDPPIVANRDIIGILLIFVMIGIVAAYTSMELNSTYHGQKAKDDGDWKAYDGARIDARLFVRRHSLLMKMEFVTWAVLVVTSIFLSFLFFDAILEASLAPYFPGVTNMFYY